MEPDKNLSSAAINVANVRPIIPQTAVVRPTIFDEDDYTPPSPPSIVRKSLVSRIISCLVGMFADPTPEPTPRERLEAEYFPPTPDQDSVPTRENSVKNSGIPSNKVVPTTAIMALNTPTTISHQFH